MSVSKQKIWLSSFSTRFTRCRGLPLHWTRMHQNVRLIPNLSTCYELQSKLTFAKYAVWKYTYCMYSQYNNRLNKMLAIISDTSSWKTWKQTGSMWVTTNNKALHECKKHMCTYNFLSDIPTNDQTQAIVHN